MCVGIYARAHTYSKRVNEREREHFAEKEIANVRDLNVSSVNLNRRRVVTKAVQHSSIRVLIAEAKHREKNGPKRKNVHKTHFACALSMVHGHNERLVSVSFVFAKDGSAVSVHLAEQNNKLNGISKFRSSFKFPGKSISISKWQCDLWLLTHTESEFNNALHFLHGDSIFEFDKISTVWIANVNKFSDEWIDMNYGKCYVENPFACSWLSLSEFYNLNHLLNQ